ncbi:MAG: flagellar biosynthesis protein FlgD [Amphritea sp.]|nr:flagellar biosynthesis protein FlgD [Amphritea sp.]
MSVNNVNNSQSVFEKINQQNQARANKTRANGADPATQSVFDRINQKNKASAKKAAGDSDLFMKLMIAQLKNQDPTSPAKTSDFMQQIATMNQVESINKLNKSFDTLSGSLLNSQAALQASSLVGQNVYAKTDQIVVGSTKSVKGVIELPTSSPDVRFVIYDKAGNKLDTVSIGSKAAGDHNFNFDASKMPEGQYRLVAEAKVGDKYKAVNSFIAYNVNSVTLGQNGVGMKVNTDAGAVSMGDIKQIG